MANSISFAGLGSGLDTSKIVDQLVAAEKSPIVGLNKRKTDTASRLSLIGDMVTKLQALKASAKSLSTPSAIPSFAASSSDESRIKVTVGTGTVPGIHNIKVDRLAQAETTRSHTFATNTAGIAGAGTLDLTVGTDAAVSVTYDGTDTLDDIAARINGSGARVSAAVLFDGTDYRLTVTSAETGLANAVSFAGVGDLLGLGDVGAEVVAAEDSQVTVNGTTITRSSNTLTDVVGGATLELRSTTPVGASNTLVQVTRDAAGLRTKVQGLVDAYNGIAKVVSGQMAYTGDGKTQRGGGTLFGDATIMGLQRELASVVTTLYANGTGDTSTGQLGITLGRDGQLTLDAAKFDAATAKDPSAIINLLAGPSNDGLAAAISSLVDRYTASSDGVLVNKQKSLTSQSSSYDKEIDRISERAESLGTRLRKQFVAMERLLSTLNSQQSYIDKIFNFKTGE